MCAVAALVDAEGWPCSTESHAESWQTGGGHSDPEAEAKQVALSGPAQTAPVAAPLAQGRMAVGETLEVMAAVRLELARRAMVAARGGEV